MLLIINTGKRNQTVGKNVAKTLPTIVQSNDASLVKSESVLDTKQIANKCNAVKTQSAVETCKSSIQRAYSCSQVSILC